MGNIVSLKGVIVPLDWDYDTDEVISLALEADDDETYIIDGEEMTEELEEFLNSFVEVKGRIREDEDGDYHINIESYKIE